MLTRLTEFRRALVLLLGGVAVPRLEREEGQTLAEYALILALIAVACFVAIAFLKDQITGLFSNIGNHL